MGTDRPQSLSEYIARLKAKEPPKPAWLKRLQARDETGQVLRNGAWQPPAGKMGA